MYNFYNNLDTSILAGLGIFMVIITLIVVAFVIVCIVAEWNLFKKAGKNGWESIIPFYNTWVLIEIAGLNWWYFLISISGSILTIIEAEELSWLTTIIGYLVNFLVYYNLAKKTKQNEILYGVLGILVPFVPTIILGFSKTITFDNTIIVDKNGIFGEHKNNQSNSQSPNQPLERYCLGCGKKLVNNAKFCENCGKKVEDPQNNQ